MKDIVISGKALRRELFVFLGCLAASWLLNVYAVIHYSRPAIELVSTIGYVVVLALIVYLVLWLPRLLALLIRTLVRKK